MSTPRTLLITDVVNSTQLNDALGDVVMGDLWHAHDRLTRELIAALNGQEVARSDGFLVLFDRVEDAAAFAMAYHQSLRSLDTPLEARVGLHVGPVTLRHNSEVDRLRGAPPFEIDGVSLPIVARVMATATGGQTLLTAAAAVALGATALRLKSHGHWRLKGIGEPIELFEVGDDTSAFEPPPDSAKSYRVVRRFGEWAPARKIPNNVPAERDTFVGRADALSMLERLLDGPDRLITLLGIGGIGKTRLALRYARTWLGDYPGGAWFCDLSSARNVQGIVAAVSHALDLQLNDDEPIKQISTALAARGPSLVILDNFEQVARHAEATVGVWLEQAPEARFIATSREVLGIVGEQAQVLAPMAVSEAAELFARRAAAASNVSTSLDTPAVSALVKLLDGLPLAIELAAARSRMMSPKMLLERMKERFTLLASRGGRIDRQMTLRSTLDWSWDLLTAAEKSALAQLSVFDAGFTLEGFEAVHRFGTGGRPSAALDLLQSLVDKSFVRQVADDRFDMLQMVQEYASQQLHSPGQFDGSGAEAALTAEKRHGQFFAAFAEEAVTRSRCVELGNVVVACRRAVRRGDDEVATHTLALAWAALELRGPFALGLDLSSAVIDMPGLANVSFPLNVRGAALRALGRTQEARTCFDAALAAAREAADRVCEAAALSSLGTLSATAGRTEDARAHLSAALVMARATDSPTLECRVLNSLGSVNETIGRTDAARRDYEAALAIARRAENKRWEGTVLGNLGNLQYAQGRIDEARASYEAGLVIAREIGNRKVEGNMLCNLGLMHQLQGDADLARRHLASALELAHEMGHARLEFFVMCNLGIVEQSASNFADAQSHFESALAVAVNLADRRAQGQTLGYLGLSHCTRGRFDEGRRLIDAGEEHLRSVSNETDLALLLCQSAEAHALAGHHDAARLTLEEAWLLSERSRGAEGSELKMALDHVRSLLAEASTVAG